MKVFFLEKKFYFLVFLPILINYAPESFWIRGRILQVFDGDTVELQRLGRKKKERVRLVYIDAAEMSQTPWGQSSKKQLETWVLGKEARIRIVGRGYYGRLLGEVFLNGQSLNLRLLEKGEAFLYPWSHFLSLKQKNDYIKTEKIARDLKKGVWGDKVLKPWTYRRLKRKK